MRQQRTKDHTVGSQQESTVESIPAYDGGITSHQYQKRQISCDTLQCFFDIFQCRIKVQETADCEGDKIHDQ